ncbi:hypothetical protein FisN_9Hh018 [Fistulifera solaris]|uniref:Uncharacterized protein n=1 Tax=Fistulifera solaris TaxID=1519565 RepID=A0A1Z5K1Z8_FISSO|nr:hypothetical protein FisN_9Hh018 [Fistulifera solaris]|eukprot:GAX20313.1 hypothetical protein FisN_9Hh018 [Fistulifera solaris]
MTLLGVQPVFSMGTASAPAVDMSLDDMIASRRKEQNADRSVAKNRVRRQAIMDAKRGRTPAANAPSAKKQIGEQVEQAQVKRARQRRRQNKPHPKTDLKTKQATRKDRMEDSKTLQKATKTAKAIAKAPPIAAKPPPRKAVVAAVQAMEQKGFQIPDGMKMVISFAPKDGKPPKSPAAKGSMGTSTRIQEGGRGEAGRGGAGRGRRRGGGRGRS